MEFQSQSKTNWTQTSSEPPSLASTANKSSKKYPMPSTVSLNRLYRRVYRRRHCLNWRLWGSAQPIKVEARETVIIMRRVRISNRSGPYHRMSTIPQTVLKRTWEMKSIRCRIQCWARTSSTLWVRHRLGRLRGLNNQIRETIRQATGLFSGNLPRIGYRRCKNSTNAKFIPTNSQWKKKLSKLRSIRDLTVHAW